MRISKNILQWLSSGLIAVVVSCFALLGVWIVYKALHLEERLGVDEGICLLALFLGPALICSIHRSVANSWGMPIALVALGLTLGGLGVWQYLRAREALAYHVPSGLFSGVEYLFSVALGLLVTFVAVLAVVGGILAFVARRMSSDAEPVGAADAASRRG